MSDRKDQQAIYDAMQKIAAAVMADDEYRMEWISQIAAAAVSAGDLGLHVGMKIGEHFVNTVFVKTANELRGESLKSPTDGK